MTPETLDTTTLSNAQKTSELGVQDLSSLEFTANYSKDAYTTIKALENTELDFAVWFGAASDTTTPDGHDGKFEFKGKLVVYVTGGGVNEVVDMKITIAASTEITLAAT